MTLRAWRVAAIVICLAAVMYGSTVQLNGSDFWVHAKVGQLIAQNHAIPATLLFPFTEIADEKFHAHAWLASLIFYGALQVVGESYMPLLIGALGCVVFAQMTYLAYLAQPTNGLAKSLPVALMCGLVAIAGENYRHVLRPELVSLIWMGFFWIFLEKFRANEKTWQALGVLLFFVLWVNTHGSFILGLVLVAIYAVGAWLNDIQRQGWYHLRSNPKTLKLIVLTFATVLASLVNPFGWELVQFAAGFGASSGLSALPGEWMTTFDPRSMQQRGFWIAALIWTAMAFTLIARRKNADWVDILLFIAFTGLACQAIRFPVYLGLLAAMVLSRNAPSTWRAKGQQKRLYQACMLMAVASTAVAIQFGNAAKARPYGDPTRTKFSAALLQVLANPALQGNVINSIELGSELIYRAYPRLKPACDIRYDSYGLPYLGFIVNLNYDNALLVEFVNRYNVRYMLLNPTSFGDVQNLASWKAGNWVVLYADSTAVLLQYRP